MQFIRPQELSAPEVPPELEIVETYLRRQFADCEGSLREIGLATLNAGGKRLRPLLLIQCGKIFAPVSERLLRAAAAFEMVHMASLIHDDLIDRASLRRNQLPVYQRWGSQRAVLAGDYLLGAAFAILAAAGPPPLLPLLARIVQAMCRGEFSQADGGFDPSFTRERYYERIDQKTGRLFEGCCRAGALIGNAGPEPLERLAEFGREFGRAYQIGNDVSDFIGPTAETGKPNWEDFRQGVLTLPLLLLLEDPAHRDWLRSQLAARRVNETVRRQLWQRLIRAGALQEALRIAATHLSQAQEELRSLPDSEATLALDNFVERFLHKLKLSGSGLAAVES